MPKIKAFFQLTPSKMEQAANAGAIEEEAVANAEAEIAEITAEQESLTLMDLEDISESVHTS